MTTHNSGGVAWGKLKLFGTYHAWTDQMTRPSSLCKHHVRYDQAAIAFDGKQQAGQFCLECVDVFNQFARTGDQVQAESHVVAEVMSAALEFDYAALPTDQQILLRQRTGEIKERVRRAAADLLEIGKALIEIKATLPHGQFGSWLAAEFGWSDRTARNYMQVAEAFKTETGSDLAAISAKALYLLSSPDVPEAARTEALAQAAQGQAVNLDDATAIISDKLAAQEWTFESARAYLKLHKWRIQPYAGRPDSGMYHLFDAAGTKVATADLKSCMYHAKNTIEQAKTTPPEVVTEQTQAEEVERIRALLQSHGWTLEQLPTGGYCAASPNATTLINDRTPQAVWQKAQRWITSARNAAEPPTPASASLADVGEPAPGFDPAPAPDSTPTDTAKLIHSLAEQKFYGLIASLDELARTMPARTSLRPTPDDEDAGINQFRGHLTAIQQAFKTIVAHVAAAQRAQQSSQDDHQSIVA